MKNRLILSLFLVCLSLSIAQAETKNIESKIKHVIVYPSGATISREAITTVPKGSHTLRFYGISPSIDQNSIQLEAKGDYIVQSIAYRYDYVSPVKEPKQVKILQDSLVLLGDKLSEIAGERFAYEQELSFILANKTIGNQQISTQSEELGKIADIIRNRILAIKKALYTISLTERKIGERSRKIQAQINEIRGNSPQPQGIIEIQLLAEEIISGTFKLNYLVNNAGWHPVYDLRFTDINLPISAKYNAYVQQTTGVDWANVTLTLSTSTPSQNNTKPILHPWQLYYKNPIEYRLKNTMILDSYKYEDKEAGASVDSIDDFSPAKNSADFTQIMESVLALDFEVSLPYTIPSDGNARVINLRKMDIPSSYTYYAAPKIEQEAFLVANLTEWASMQLLPGTANIFMGNTYMGASYLNPGIGSDTIAIAFGRDKMVQIDRQLLTRECKKSRIAGKQRHNLSYEITVRNLHKTEIKLIIEDQIPISSIEEIEVELKEKSGAAYVEKTGLLTWDLVIKAGQSDKKKFSFEVRHPRDKVVYPLNYM